MTCAAGFRRRMPSKSGCRTSTTNSRSGGLLRRGIRNDGFTAVRLEATAAQGVAPWWGSAICGGRESPLEKLYESTNGDRHRREGPPYQFGFNEVWHVR